MQNKLDLTVGTVYNLHYNENNISNIPHYEIRGVVDDEVVVIYGITKGGKSFHKLIYLDFFQELFDKGILKNIL